MILHSIWTNTKELMVKWYRCVTPKWWTSRTRICPVCMQAKNRKEKNEINYMALDDEGNRKPYKMNICNECAARLEFMQNNGLIGKEKNETSNVSVSSMYNIGSGFDGM